jgi:hypothetical protein
MVLAVPPAARDAVLAGATGEGIETIVIGEVVPAAASAGRRYEEVG